MKKNTERPAYSHEEYINLVLDTGNVMTHDYSNQSVEEDPRMLAFFDSLVQRELEGFSSSDDLASSEEEMLDRIQNLTDTDLTDSDSNPLQNNVDNDSVTFNPFTVAFASAVNSNDNVTSSNGHYSEISESSDSDSSSSDNNSNQGGKSIEQLIKQRRKEMKKNGINKRKRPLVTYSTDSSSDSENETTRNSNASSSVNNGQVQEQGHPFSILSACRQNKNLQLKRLKLLRRNALNSDSDQTEEENLEENPVLNDNKTEEGDNVTENSKCEELQNCKNTEGKEMGPYLHEAENLPSCSKSSPSSTEFSLINNENGDGPEENDMENNRENWTEFKRFKNGVKLRRYRSHSKSEDS